MLLLPSFCLCLFGNLISLSFFLKTLHILPVFYLSKHSFRLISFLINKVSCEDTQNLETNCFILLLSLSSCIRVGKMALLCCFNSVSDVPGSGGSGRSSSGKKHRCTDATFLGIFIVFWLGLIFVGTYAWLVGNPLRMIHGSDSFGNVW